MRSRTMYEQDGESKRSTRLLDGSVKLTMRPIVGAGGQLSASAPCTERRPLGQPRRRHRLMRGASAYAPPSTYYKYPLRAVQSVAVAALVPFCFLQSVLSVFGLVLQQCLRNRRLVLLAWVPWVSAWPPT